MGFSKFGFKIGLRLILILLALASCGYLSIQPGYPITALLMAALTIGLAWELFRFVSRTNREVSRFLDAARYADFGQRFEFDDLGAGFTELGDTFTLILERFRQDRSEQEKELRQLKAMLEHVPVPLLSIHANEYLELWNNAARKLFGTVAINHLDDLALFGADIPQQIRKLRSSERALINIQMDGQLQTFSVASSEISLADTRRRLISLQNIQNVLDTTQLQAWQDLVRVLTHEIMNSITPVASLAQTTVDLVDDVRNKMSDTPALMEELDDVKAAVSTVARRSEGLMNFVASYRQLTRLPPPTKTRFNLSELFSDVSRMIQAETDHQGRTELSISIQPEALQLNADRQMIEQVLINLLQNAQHSVPEKGQIRMLGSLNPRGQVSVSVTDNGPGIEADIIDKIFVPFFTTRASGSGVGLALSRQIMIAHGGRITYTAAEKGGACFTLTF